MPLKLYHEQDHDFPDIYRPFLLKSTIQKYASTEDGTLLWQRYLSERMGFCRVKLDCSHTFRVQANAEVPAFYLLLAVKSNLYADFDHQYAKELLEGHCQMNWYDENELVFVLPAGSYEFALLRISREMMGSLAQRSEPVQWLLRHAGGLLEQVANPVVTISDQMTMQYQAILEALRRGRSQEQIELAAGKLVIMYALSLCRLVNPLDGDDEMLEEKILRYIREHIDAAISIPEMAAALHMSETVLGRTCKELAGVSPAKLIMQQRILRTSQLLTETSLSVPEIAFCIGFTDASHLTREFKKYKQCTPAAYREAWKAGKRL